MKTIADGYPIVAMHTPNPGTTTFQARQESIQATPQQIEQHIAYLSGNFLDRTDKIVSCLARKLSPKSFMLEARQGAVSEEDTINATFDLVGKIEGTVKAKNYNGFTLQISPDFHDHVAERLNWLSQHAQHGYRRHERIVPLVTKTRWRDRNSEWRPARIVNLSISGAAFKTHELPPIGRSIIIGQQERPAIVIRTFEAGFAVEFEHPIPEPEFSEKFVL